MIKHKEALLEIFEAAKAVGGSLHGKCDTIITTASVSIPGDGKRFITLGSFSVSDVAVGRVIDKYTVIYQDILCGSRVDAHGSVEAEEEAEQEAFELARLVRTLLKNNHTLISESYPTGVARTTKMRGTPIEPIIYGGSPSFMATVTALISIKEDAS